MHVVDTCAWGRYARIAGRLCTALPALLRVLASTASSPADAARERCASLRPGSTWVLLGDTSGVKGEERALRILLRDYCEIEVPKRGLWAAGGSTVCHASPPRGQRHRPQQELIGSNRQSTSRCSTLIRQPPRRTRMQRAHASACASTSQSSSERGELTGTADGDIVASVHRRPNCAKIVSSGVLYGMSV